MAVYALVRGLGVGRARTAARGAHMRQEHRSWSSPVVSTVSSGGRHAELIAQRQSRVHLDLANTKYRQRCSVAASSSHDEIATNTSSNGIWTIPTILTLLRVVAIPLLVAAWFSNCWTTCFLLFVGASITDFFDGYLARKWNCSTPFGAFLDPVADKLMVATILILIGTVPVPAGFFAGNDWLLPAIACVIIAREITMSALREWAAALGPEAHAAAAVNKLGKYKTSSQMASLVMLLGAKMSWIVEKGCEAICTDVGMGLLFVATFLTVQSVLGYFVGLWRFFV